MPNDSTPSSARARLKLPNRAASMSSIRFTAYSAIGTSRSRTNVRAFIYSDDGRGNHQGGEDAGGDPRPRRRPRLGGGPRGPDDRPPPHRPGDEQERPLRPLRLEA